MKEKFTVFAAALFMLAACQAEPQITQEIAPAQASEQPQTVEEGVVPPEVTASQENGAPTKSLIEVDGEGVGTIYWTPSDEINVFYGSTSTRYISKNTENATTAVFRTLDVIGTTESATENIWGLYPYNENASCTGSAVTTTLPANQKGVPGTFDDDLYITLAHNTSTALVFWNVCGGIKFSLSRNDITSITFRGNNNEDIAGDISLTFDGETNLPVATVLNGAKEITLTPKTGTTFASGENYYLILLPGTLENGFTMTFTTTDASTGTFNYTDKAVTIKRSVFSKKAEIDTYATFVTTPMVTNLSEHGTANCYIVPAAGDYKFNALVKGNSEESVGIPVSAEVLWESFGTNVAPNVGDLVNSVSLEEGFVHFSATEAKGNAVVAVKDGDGTILWSWHIWCTDVPVEHNYNNNAGIMMDRNLGATVTTPDDIRSNGLLYQWGRKDPFLGGQSYTNTSVSNQDRALSTAIWPSAEEVSTHLSDNTTLLFALSHPMTYIYNSTDSRDWYCLTKGYQNNGLWGSEKTIYDPCPSGWHVPASCYKLSSVASNGIWADAINNGQRQFQVTVTTKEYGYNFGRNNLLGQYSTIWYPCAGYYTDNGSLYATGDIAYYWSSSSSEFSESWNSNMFEFNTISAAQYKKVSIEFYYSNRQNGHSVRCQKD